MPSIRGISRVTKRDELSKGLPVNEVSSTSIEFRHPGTSLNTSLTGLNAGERYENDASQVLKGLYAPPRDVDRWRVFRRRRQPPADLLLRTKYPRQYPTVPAVSEA